MLPSALEDFGQRQKNMETLDKSIESEFLGWLGSEIFCESHIDRYVAAFHKCLPHSQRDLQQCREHDWEKFLAAIDTWASRQMSEFMPDKVAERIMFLPLPESRDSFTGLRRGHCVEKLSINVTDEEALRQVPGIGASSAQKILEERASHGSFKSLEQLVEYGCLSVEALQLSQQYITVSVTHSPFDGIIRKANFVTYVRVQHALQHTGSDVDLMHVGITELERSVDSLNANKYWEASRTIRDPMMLSNDEGNILYRKVSDSKQNLPTSLLDSQSYLKLLNRIFPRAKASIWVQAPSLSILHVGALRTLLTALADASAHNVDVRILFDGNYSPSSIESDDVAYLRARNVPCRAYTLSARMHSRVIIVDGEHVICGSHSWSATSMFHSEELSIYTHSQRLAEQQAERFQLLWHESKPE